MATGVLAGGPGRVCLLNCLQRVHGLGEYETGTRVSGAPLSPLVNQLACELRCGDAPWPFPPARWGAGRERGPEKDNTARTAQSPPL